jgi:hypothetical protein
MSFHENAKAGVKSLVLKIGSGIVGLVVAGGLMWFTPFIDRFVKPAKPLANFATEPGDNDLTITFKNLSQNAKQAKWDFGDGSPLEIVAGNITELKHKFKKANSYTVKLVVSNVVDQEDSRTSTIAVGIKPQIIDLSLKPINQKTKPYTAGVKVKFEATSDLDAKFEWDFGDGIYVDGSETMQHEFNMPGKHLVKVRAVMGHLRGSPSLQEIEVLPLSGASIPVSTRSPDRTNRTPETISVDVSVRSVMSAGVLHQDRLRVVNLRGKGTSATLSETITATPGYVIKSVAFEKLTMKKSANVINESVTTGSDGRSALVTAQLSKLGQDYSFNVAVKYVEELAPTTPREAKAVITLPGVSTLELPAGEKHELEIKHAGQTIVKLNEMTGQHAEFSVNGRAWQLTTTRLRNKVTVTLRPGPTKFLN